MNAYVYTRLPSFIRWAEGVEESFWIWQTSTFTLVNASAVGWFILFILPRHPAPQSLAGRDSKRADKKWRSTKSFVLRNSPFFQRLKKVPSLILRISTWKFVPQSIELIIKSPIALVSLSFSVYLSLSLSLSVPRLTNRKEKKRFVVERENIFGNKRSFSI